MPGAGAGVSGGGQHAGVSDWRLDARSDERAFQGIGSAGRSRPLLARRESLFPSVHRGVGRRQCLFPSVQRDIGRRESLFPSVQRDIGRRESLFPSVHRDVGRRESLFPSVHRDVERRESLFPSVHRDVGRRESFFPSIHRDVGRRESLFPSIHRGVGRRESLFPSIHRDAGRRESLFPSVHRAALRRRFAEVSVLSGLGRSRSAAAKRGYHLELGLRPNGLIGSVAGSLGAAAPGTSLALSTTSLLCNRLVVQRTEGALQGGLVLGQVELVVARG